ncbi:hypothetical protein [Williamsoniiplasma lucivorax]|uniref:Uncharacterized protein n=1 Tax=Williamsoniiplasma lucivorax TaxID=209274 RepID=A0A2S5RFP8_9MOLU|nr:hypothetical protein [Williamsoniiplasma lucivorax]PPE06042.1 hypothetical protein ELUCI_v1c03330 [Williamsoniiplasma lucivorax]
MEQEFDFEFGIKDIYPTIQKEISKDENVIGGIVSRKVEANNVVSSIYVELVLTDYNLWVFQKDKNKPDSEVEFERTDIRDVRMISIEKSKNNSNNVIISLVVKNNFFVLESEQKSLAEDFVNTMKKHILKTHNDQEYYKFTDVNDEELNNFVDIENQKTPKVETKKTTAKEVAKFFFNHTSIFKSAPTLEVLLMLFSFVWWILGITFISIFDHVAPNKPANATFYSLGVLMIVFSLLNGLTLIPYFMNFMEKDQINKKMIKALLLILFDILLFVTSVMMVAKSNVVAIFLIIDLILIVLVLFWATIDLARDILEIKHQAKLEQK